MNMDMVTGEFTICYDRFCLGRFSLKCDEEGRVVPFEELGGLEMYVLGMWNDGMAVTMKEYCGVMDENRFVLLLPDGSEQSMIFTREQGFVVSPLCGRGEGRLAYLLEFMGGLEYRGVRGYEEYDEEEGVICGVANAGERTLTYCGENFNALKRDFVRVVDEFMCTFAG